MALEDESRELDVVVARLDARFRDAGRDEIRTIVRTELGRYDDATVRDFVPIYNRRG